MRLPLPLVLLGGLLALTAAPAVAVSSASVADLTLANVAYSHVARTSSGMLLLTATNDSPTGFSVTIQSSDFGYTGVHSGAQIPAANFVLISAEEPEMVAGQAVDPTAGPRVPITGASGPLNVPRKTVQANAGFGVGSYTQALAVSLTVPGQSRTGTYTATLTTTIGAGP